MTIKQAAIDLIVALKGHTLPREAEIAYNRLSKAVSDENIGALGIPVNVDVTSPKNIDESLANAAPILLDSLQEICCQFLQRGVFVDENHPDRIALKNAEFAIKKATGGRRKF